MARTGLAYDQRFREHRTGMGHPERPERLESIASALTRTGLFDACVEVVAEPVDMALVRRVHNDEYLERVERTCAAGRPFIDVPDSQICGESFEIAKLAAGACIRAVDEVMAGRLDNAFCAVRPPGHHAERHMSMGFCLMNNIAIAARHLLDDHGLSRVLILDWDVHHGNGTQHTFEDTPHVLFISLHGHPGIVYPGTGYADERGRGPGEGYTMNFAILPPSSDGEYRRIFDEKILPAIEGYRPEFVLVSAGFDAHRLDPLAPLELATESFGWMTETVAAVARAQCGGKLVSLLEGGYHLDALADCVTLHVEKLRSV